MTMTNISEWFKHLDWSGIIVFTLAIGVSISMVLIIVGAMMRTNPMGESAATMISTIFGASIGTIATYVGRTQRKEESNVQ